ncbi:MAG TPA: hypothetical protein VFC67_15005 [Prolixibacteraceae bacterium]|nr:hypothetical protein [Prolixibacteraceae bacterium]
MNRLILLLFSLLVCGLISCNGISKSNGRVKPVEKTDNCKLDSKNTYEVYIPERKNASDKLPLLVIIDAHGSGKFALNKFKQAANQYPSVLIASNLVKNGFEGYEGAIQTLIEDVHQKYPVGETVFITGFSGGARMALGYALAHHQNGLILCGALANPDQINALHCPVISISGMDDFNFIETAQYLFQEQSTPGNLKIELTNASHAWPDSQMLANAFGFLRISCMAADDPSLPKSQLKLYCQKQQSRIDSLRQQGDFLKAVLVARNMSSTEPFNSDKTFASTCSTLKTNPEYISQMSRLEKGLNYEISVHQPYLEAFRTKDTLWWKNEIRTSEEKIKTEQDPYTKDTYLRIKGFLGIASYTFCKQAVKEQNAEALNKILSIYRMLEPENPDMFYFSSFPYFWKGDNEATLSMVKKALDAGFTDRSQLKKDFPESITSKL